LEGDRSLQPPLHDMHPRSQGPRVFGPFDGDFDPFEDDADATVLIPLERRPRGGSDRRPAASAPARRCPV